MTKTEAKLLRDANHYNPYSKRVEGTHYNNFGVRFAKFLKKGWIVEREPASVFYVLTQEGIDALARTRDPHGQTA